jgi:hypothetical protein
MSQPGVLGRLFTFMHGRTMVIDGVDGEIVYDAQSATPLLHCATEAGRASLAYKNVKALMGDDWDTDLLKSDFAFEAFCAEAERLGFWTLETLSHGTTHDDMCRTERR